jgi:hypothetical protein
MWGSEWDALQQIGLCRHGSGIDGGKRLVVAVQGGGRCCLSVIGQAGDGGCRLADVRLFGKSAGDRAGTGAVSLFREESDMLGSYH